MVQFRSFEETLALIGAVAGAGIAYKLFNATLFAVLRSMRRAILAVAVSPVIPGS
jgi:phosphate/sulfate permease